MKAIRITDHREPIQIQEIEKPVISPGECLVKIEYAALNRRDQWIREGKYPRITPNVTLGSDGCGKVVEGEKSLIGKEVVINPNIGWGKNEAAADKNYSILGLPADGTFAEYIKVTSDRLHLKPSHLSSIEAAGLPLAGMTAFRALFTKGKLKTENKVLITGAGGGVSQMAICFAKAVGSTVYVTSGSDMKIERSISSGAKNGYNYNDDEWFKSLIKDSGGGVDLVIDSAGGSSINQYLKVITPGGTVVVYGGTTGRVPEFDVYRLFWAQATIAGTSMASDMEFRKMLSFVTENKLKPVIDKVYGVEAYVQAFDRMKDSHQYGKIVISF